jgi:hypothetical protein
MGKAWRRDPLDKDRAALRAMRRAREQRNMSPKQIEQAMRKIIRQKLELSEPIHRDDFLRANLPPAAITANFQRVLQAVQYSMATGVD